MHGILSIQERAITKGKHTLTTVYNSCVHTFRKSNNGTTSSEILAKFFLETPFKRATGPKISKQILFQLFLVSGGQQFLFGFGLLISDFLVFVNFVLLVKIQSFFSALAALLACSSFFFYFFVSILIFSDLGPEKGFVMEHQGNCLLADEI